jgi:hypothetical protein
VRSAVVNTADQGVLKNYASGNVQNVVNITGAGRENLYAATGAAITLDPVSVSFGAVPSGSGQSRQFTVTLTNTAATQQTLSLAVDGSPAGVSYSVAPTSISLDAGASAQVVVTMQADRGASAGGKQGFLRVSVSGSEVAHGALYTLIK